MDALLEKEGIARDANLEYTAGLFDDEFNLVGTGSAFADTLRCLAVDRSRQGEGLMNRIVSHLTDRQVRHGHSHLFLYTKTDKAPVFADMGFHEIARVAHTLVFMENRRDGFASFLRALEVHKREGKSAALVMNCNPFTLGHRHLVERAAAENDTVHLFAVSEDASLIPFADRYAMIRSGCADLTNIIFHTTGSYMISSAVFPSYFLESDEAAIRAQTALDVLLFARIARSLNVTRRYVGEEPCSKVTGIYNETMLRELPPAGIECVVIPRKELDGRPISASDVRRLIRDSTLEAICPLVPPGTYAYFQSEAGQKAVSRIKNATAVAHY
jgi:[citrate (pro-3S)-lyase] ligase